MMKKRILLLACLLTAGVCLSAQNPPTDKEMQMALAYPETDVVSQPTKELLTGIWQAGRANDKGRRLGGLGFKVFLADGTFSNLYVTGPDMFVHQLGTGRWNLKGNELVEQVDGNTPNAFAGTVNHLQLKLSEQGKVMHLSYKLQNGNTVHEYWVKVK